MRPRFLRRSALLIQFMVISSRVSGLRNLDTTSSRDLFPVWCLVDSLEQAGEMAADDAVRWKHGIYGLMMMWGLEPDDLVSVLA